MVLEAIRKMFLMSFTLARPLVRASASVTSGCCLDHSRGPLGGLLRTFGVHWGRKLTKLYTFASRCHLGRLYLVSRCGARLLLCVERECFCAQKTLVRSFAFLFVTRAHLVLS